MNNGTMPPSLKLVFDHLTAVRELDRYLHKKGVDKDLQRYLEEGFRMAVQDCIPTLKSWECEVSEEVVYWCPAEWAIGDGLHVSLCMSLPGPLSLNDDDASVSVHVPSDWPGYGQVNPSTPWVKELIDAGFELARDHDDWIAEFAVAKYVRYLSDGSFNEEDFVKRICLEAEKVIRLEPQISKTIFGVSVKSPGSTRIQTGPRAPTGRA